jgi:hypothetical protein
VWADGQRTAAEELARSTAEDAPRRVVIQRKHGRHHGPEPAAVAAAYDFSQFETIVDVGGATGNHLAAVLSRHPGPRGILFDLPHVVRDAPVLI